MLMGNESEVKRAGIATNIIIITVFHESCEKKKKAHLILCIEMHKENLQEKSSYAHREDMLFSLICSHSTQSYYHHHRENYYDNMTFCSDSSSPRILRGPYFFEHAKIQDAKKA